MATHDINEIREQPRFFNCGIDINTGIFNVAHVDLDGLQAAKGYVWDTDLLAYVKMTQPVLNAETVNIPGTITVNGMTQLTAKYAAKVQIVGNYVYEASAAVGSAESSAVWQAKRTYCGEPLKVTWADGNELFDNVASDLSALSYS